MDKARLIVDNLFQLLTGGSDVSGGTETVALEQPDGSHQLFGYKWFSSATDSDMSLTLANIISEDQPEPVSSHIIKSTLYLY